VRHTGSIGSIGHVSSVTGAHNLCPVRGWLTEPIALVGDVQPPFRTGLRGWIDGWVDSLFCLVDWFR
jgi:hypothetical protein